MELGGGEREFSQTRKLGPSMKLWLQGFWEDAVKKIAPELLQPGSQRRPDRDTQPDLKRDFSPEPNKTEFYP